MTPYELTNDQRCYFGLTLVQDSWEKVQYSDTLTVYFENDKIVKLLKYTYGYCEDDIPVETRKRQFILPKTPRGKEQKLTVARLLNIEGPGIKFSGSFQGGGITVYNTKTRRFFISSYFEEGDIRSFSDIDKWVTDYINQSPAGYFDWLNQELSIKLQQVKFREGDIIAFQIGRNEYGFARILFNVFRQRENPEPVFPTWHWVHPRSIIVAPYAWCADRLDIDLDELISKKTLPSFYMFDTDVYRGIMPVIGHRPLSAQDKQITLPEKTSTSITIPLTKTDIKTFMETTI